MGASDCQRNNLVRCQQGWALWQRGRSFTACSTLRDFHLSSCGALCISIRTLHPAASDCVENRLWRFPTVLTVLDNSPRAISLPSQSYAHGSGPHGGHPFRAAAVRGGLLIESGKPEGKNRCICPGSFLRMAPQSALL